MDNLIRALNISSEQAVPLSLRRPRPEAGSEPSAGGAASGAVHSVGQGNNHSASRFNGIGHISQGGSQIAGTDVDPQTISAISDPLWLESERKKIETELLRQFDLRVEAAQEDARRRGREEGLETGRAEALAGFERQREAVKQVLAAVAGRAESEIADAEDLVVGLAFEAVCKILAERVVSRDTISAMVQQLVGRVSREEAVRVRLHPQDCSLLGEISGTDFTADGKGMRVELVPDEEIVCGGCVVETAKGHLDARIEVQLQGLREAMMRVRRGAARDTGNES